MEADMWKAIVRPAACAWSVFVIVHSDVGYSFIPNRFIAAAAHASRYWK